MNRGGEQSVSRLIILKKKKPVNKTTRCSSAECDGHVVRPWWCCKQNGWYCGPRTVPGTSAVPRMDLLRRSASACSTPFMKFQWLLAVTVWRATVVAPPRPADTRSRSSVAHCLFSSKAVKSWLPINYNSTKRVQWQILH